MEKVNLKTDLTNQGEGNLRIEQRISSHPCNKQWLYLYVIPLMFLAVNCSYAQSGESGESGEVIVINKADFLSKVYNYEKNTAEWVYEGTQPCIIDFYADWCGPCKRIAPIMKELATEYKGKIIFYKVDVESERELASVFGINSIPLILFVPVEGKPQAAAGALPKKTMIEQIDQYLLKK